MNNKRLTGSMEPGIPKIRFWQIVFYISWSIVGLWLILKFTGVINTPAWLEQGIPLAGLFLGSLALYRDLVMSINQVVIMQVAMKKDVEKEFIMLTQRMERLEKKV